jgi:hypothetical protein
MPIDKVSQARRAQGHFANQRSAALPAAAEAHRPAPRPLAQPGLRIGKAHPLVVAALLLSVASPRGGPLPVPGRERAGGTPGSALALLPGAHAVVQGVRPDGAVNEVLEHLVPGNRIAPDDTAGFGQAAATLASVGNAAVATCVMTPRRCPQAVLTAVLAGATVLGSAAVDNAVQALWGAGDEPVPAPGGAAYDAADHVLHQLPPRDRQALLAVLRDCGEAPACAGQIRALLLSLPAPVQQGIEDALARTAVAPGVTAAGWPPMAQAMSPASPLSWLETAITLLEGLYDPAQAAYLLDLEQIAQTTLHAQAGQPRGMRELLANQQRNMAIEALFNDTGHPVDRRPFNISAHDLRGVPRTAWGRNLLLTFSGPGTPAHTLMLVAHGDMTGTDTHSSGVLDNGTGVATLLALARELQDTDLPPGTRVQLLVTDQGERGMMGAKAYVQQCLAHRECPDAVLNLDMLGRGEALAICGSEQRHLFVMDTQRVDQRHPGEVNAHERHLRQLVQEAAVALGVRQHPATAWTQVSDHLPFQREGIAALGLTRMTAAELGAEEQLQATYAELLRRHAAVDWSRMDDYLNGRLSRADSDDVRERLAEHAAVSRRYRRLEHSAYRGTVHNGLDQPELIQTRAALETLGVVRRTVHAWLVGPDSTRA